MFSEPNYDARKCVECNREYRRKLNEGVKRFQLRTFCGQSCARALRKRTMNKVAHPDDVKARLAELGR